MHVAATSLSVVKGCRQESVSSIGLGSGTVVGNRRFALVDLDGGTVLRSVDHGWLAGVRASLGPSGLALSAGCSVVVGRVRPTPPATVDFWGRLVPAYPVPGPWVPWLRDIGSLPSAEVALAAFNPGDVVYGAPLTLVTTGSLAVLAAELGSAVQASRFRANVVVRAEGPQEAAWPGRRLRLGDAIVRVRAPVERCRVIDADPETGRRDVRLLAALRERVAGAAPTFGMSADVERAGRVRPGDQVALLS